MQQSTAKAIIDFLSRDESAATIVIAPGAPPVLRGEKGVTVALEMIMTPLEITETMMAFRNHAQLSEAMVTRASGSFAFPVSKVGRFRVDYLMQRGSYVLTVTRTSSKVPSFDALFDNQAPAMMVLDLIKTGHVSVVTVFSVDAATNAAFVCSMLQKINGTPGINRLICTVEQSLSYLIRHDNSIVVQCEADTDVPTLEAGIQNVLGLRPDILYVSDVRADTELVQVRAAVGRGITTIISSTVMDHAYMSSRLLSSGRDGEAPDPNRRWLPVSLTALADGKLSLSVGESASPGTAPRLRSISGGGAGGKLVSSTLKP
jgi:Tfp pilus assembly ATPase PilU